MKKKTFQIVILLLLNIIFIGTANASTNLVGLKAVKNYDFGNVGRVNWIMNSTNRNQDIYWFFQNKHAITEDYIVFTANLTTNDVSQTNYTEEVNPLGFVPNEFRTSISIWLLYNDQQISQCSIDFDDGLILCPIRTHTSGLNALKVWFRSNDTTNNYWETVSLLMQQIAVSYNNINGQIVSEQQKTNTKLDEIQNSDISNDSKESPNTNEFNDYQKAENGLFDKMKQADTNNLDVAIDGNSANFVWDTITRFYNSNALLMNFLISILSIGIIKMALGR